MTDVATLFKTIADSFAALSELYAASGLTDADPTPQATIEQPLHSEEVRAALARKAQEDGKKYRPDVKALVQKYSTDGTFIHIPPEKYSELMNDLEAIGND